METAHVATDVAVSVRLVLCHTCEYRCTSYVGWMDRCNPSFVFKVHPLNLTHMQASGVLHHTYSIIIRPTRQALSVNGLPYDLNGHLAQLATAFAAGLLVLNPV